MDSRRSCHPPGVARYKIGCLAEDMGVGNKIRESNSGAVAMLSNVVEEGEP